MNKLSYADGLLAIPYFKKDEKQMFIAVFDMDDLNYTKVLPTPFFMFGGIYQELDRVEDLRVLNVLEFD